jgi:hypothetical protein
VSGCGEDGDEVVFGPCRKCSPKPPPDPHEYRENPIHLLLGEDELYD